MTKNRSTVPQMRGVSAFLSTPLGEPASTNLVSGSVRFFCEDETRLGLKTISGRKITVKGLQPQGKVQWQFQATYLDGIVEPATGESFVYEFTHLNSDCFQVFLD